MSQEPSKDPIPDSREGMTVGERLYIEGVLDAFTKAALNRDRTKMVDLLIVAGFSRKEAEQIADIDLADPRGNELRRRGWR